MPPLAALLNALLRHRRLLIGLPFAGMILGGGIVVLTRKYTADAFFTPQGSQQNQSRLSGVVAQLGLPLNLGGDVESVDFYRNLLLSRDLLGDAVRSQFRFATIRGGTDSLGGTLLDIYKVKGKTPVDQVTRGVNRLRGRISVGTDRAASVVGLRVTTPWPELSEQVAARLLELVNQFNLEKRQSRYAAERAFLEKRLELAQQELTAAEDQQKRFLERNRAYRDDPALSTEMQRLSRRVDQAAQLYQSIHQMFEEARIEEVRNTPVVTVLQNPLGTAHGTPRLSLGMALGLFFGGTVALTFVLLQEYALRERELNPAAYDEIQAAGERLARRLRLQGSK